MSSVDCGNCDCPDKSQCKKGNKFGMEIIQPPVHMNSQAMDMGFEAIVNGCKCGPNCSCNGCTCDS